MTTVKKKSLYYAFVVSVICLLIIVSTKLYSEGSDSLALICLSGSLLITSWLIVFKFKVLTLKSPEQLFNFVLIHFGGSVLVGGVALIYSDSLYLESAIVFAYNIIAALLFQKHYVSIFD